MFQTTNQTSILYHGQHISLIKNIVVTVCHTHHHEPWGFNYLHCPIFDVSNESLQPPAGHQFLGQWFNPGHELVNNLDEFRYIYIYHYISLYIILEPPSTHKIATSPKIIFPNALTTWIGEIIGTWRVSVGKHHASELHGLKVLARQNPQQRILQPSSQVQQPSQLNGGRQGHQLVAGGGGQVT